MLTDFCSWFKTLNLDIYRGVPTKQCYFKDWRLLIKEQSVCVSSGHLRWMFYQLIVSNILTESLVMGKSVFQHNTLSSQWYTLSKTAFSTYEIYLHLTVIDYYNFVFHNLILQCNIVWSIMPPVFFIFVFVLQDCFIQGLCSSIWILGSFSLFSWKIT